MKRLAPALALALLAACQQPAADDYVFVKAEWFLPNIPIRAVYYPSLESLRAAAPASAKAEEGAALMGWSTIKADHSLCTMHLLDPRVKYMPEWVGHETAHCHFGRWHS